MTKVQTITMAAIAALALAAAALLTTGAMTSAQTGDEATPTPTPTATGEPTDETPTPTPDASEESDEGTADEDAAGDDSTGEDAAGDDADASGDGEANEDATTTGCAGGHLLKAAAAEVLGIGEDELRESLRDGQTLAEIAEGQGMSREEFRSALLENVSADLQARLDTGEITQEKFDEVNGSLEEKVDSALDAEGGLGFRGFHGRPSEESEGSEA
ncbi:MAG: hypothetical protein WD379_08805 [Dehalococcoidia bacterium]